MSISEEKFEKLLTVLQETLEDQRRMHADNHAMQKEMREMLKEQIRDHKKKMNQTLRSSTPHKT